MLQEEAESHQLSLSPQTETAGNGVCVCREAFCRPQMKLFHLSREKSP